MDGYGTDRDGGCMNIEDKVLDWQSRLYGLECIVFYCKRNIKPKHMALNGTELDFIRNKLEEMIDEMNEYNGVDVSRKAGRAG